MSIPKRPKDEFLQEQEDWVEEHVYITEAQVELAKQIESEEKDKPEAIVQLTKTPNDEPEEEYRLPF